MKGGGTASLRELRKNESAHGAADNTGTHRKSEEVFPAPNKMVNEFLPKAQLYGDGHLGSDMEEEERSSKFN